MSEKLFTYGAGFGGDYALFRPYVKRLAWRLPDSFYYTATSNPITIQSDAPGTNILYLKFHANFWAGGTRWWSLDHAITDLYVILKSDGSHVSAGAVDFGFAFRGDPLLRTLDLGYFFFSEFHLLTLPPSPTVWP